MKTALVVVFNNPFPKNIYLLERMYCSKFDRIFYLIDAPPVHPDIIRVQGHSHTFQKFYLQAIDQLRGYDYYFFIHDDAVLNPLFSAKTAFSNFKIPDDAICMRNLEMIPQASTWYFTWRGAYDVVAENKDLRTTLKSIKSQLVRRYKEQIIPAGCYSHDLSEWENTVKTQSEILFGKGAYADILMMPAAALEDMIIALKQLQGSDLFVEAAIPTAIMMTDWKLYLMDSSPKSPVYYWKKEVQKLPLIYLIRMCLKKRIAIHPVKFGQMSCLTRWLYVVVYLWLGKSASSEKERTCCVSSKNSR